MLIRRVTSDAIIIGDRSFTDTIVLTTDAMLEDFVSAPIAELEIEHFELLLATDPELVLLGTGSRNIFPPRELVFAFARRGVGLEVMDTPAAARTFNVLAGEGRRLGAVLYL
jgi:uncharacterized protein